MERPEWNKASRDSLPDNPRISPPDPQHLVGVFDKITVERNPAPAPAIDAELAKAMSLQNTTYQNRDGSELTGGREATAAAGQRSAQYGGKQTERPTERGG